jgi:hypothetical protein
VVKPFRAYFSASSASPIAVSSSASSRIFPSPSIRRFQELGDLLRTLFSYLEQFEENCNPLLLLDLDGTVWRGDLGYAVLECAEQEGLLESGHEPSIHYLQRNLSCSPHQTTLTAALSHFEETRTRYQFSASCALDRSVIALPSPPRVDQLIEVYQRCASVFQGVSATKLSQITADVLFRRKSRLGGTLDSEGGIASTVRNEVGAIRELFGRFGATEVAVTATAAVLAREGSELIDIPRDRILGIELTEHSTVQSPPVKKPVPIHAGKGIVAYQWCEKQRLQFKPVCGVGDSPLVTDWGLLMFSDIFIDVSGDSYLLIIGQPEFSARK